MNHVVRFVAPDGQLVPNKKVFVKPDALGFKYGLGLFETMLLHRGLIAHWEKHWQRLSSGMNLLGFPDFAHFPHTTLLNSLQELTQNSGWSGCARVRLNVYLGAAPPARYKQAEVHIIAEVSPHDRTLLELQPTGIAVGIFADQPKIFTPYSHLKTAQYLPSVLAAHHALCCNWDDALLLNTSGNIAESSIANLFIIKDNIVKTPALNQGCVAGVMRSHIMERYPKVVETAITPAELNNADEAFLCNSLQPIRWIQKFGEKNFTNATVIKLYNHIFGNLYYA